jgi:hypothetical protein
MEHLGLSTAQLQNPEVTAMSAICDILRELPDDDSRLRVMRWSFGRFHPEFKRPVANVIEPAAPPVEADLTTEIAAVAPDMVLKHTPRRRDADFGTQLSELGDLLPPLRPRRL